jgi:hypothetical protein
MNCKKAKKLLLDYSEDSLAGDKRRAVDNHLSRCELCRSELAQMEKLKQRILSLESPEHDADFWRNFDGKLAQKLAGEAEYPAHGGLAARHPLLRQPGVAFAAAATTILLIAVLAVIGLVVFPAPPRQPGTMPDIAWDTDELAIIDLENVEIEFFLENGDNGTEALLADLSDEDMEMLEDDIVLLLEEEDLQSASEDMVLDDIYEQTVYDSLDALSLEEIEELYNRLGLT